MLAATTAAGVPGEAIIIAVIGLLGAAATAYGGVLVERVKARASVTARSGEQRAPAHAAATDSAGNGAKVPQPGDAFQLVEDAISDLRAQRDAANSRAERVQAALDALREEMQTRIRELTDKLRDAEVHIAKLEARRYGKS